MEENNLVFLPARCEMHYECFLNEAGGEFLRDFAWVWRSAQSAICSLSAAMVLVPGNAVGMSSGSQGRGGVEEGRMEDGSVANGAGYGFYILTREAIQGLVSMDMREG